MPVWSYYWKDKENVLIIIGIIYPTNGAGKIEQNMQKSETRPPSHSTQEYIPNGLKN